MTTVPTAELKINTALSFDYHTYVVDTSLGNIILTLPLITSKSGQIVITRSDVANTVNTLVIRGSNGQLINQSTSAIIANNTTLRFIALNNSWFYGLPSIKGKPGTTGYLELAPVGSNSNINGATLNGLNLTLQSADSKFGGMVTNIKQSIPGSKRFVDTTQATSDTSGAVTVAGGVGITGKLILGVTGDPANVSGLMTNISDYTQSILREYSEVDLKVNAIQPPDGSSPHITGSTILYFTRLGKRITLTIGGFSGTSDGKSNLLFGPIQAPFIPDFPLTFPILVVMGGNAIYTDLILNMDGTITLTGAQFTNNPIPNGNFIVYQQAISYVQRQANQLVGNMSPVYDQGVSVAISGDGKTIVIGSPNDSGPPSSSGAAYIFVRSSNNVNTWSQQARFQAYFASNQGSSVAISYNGNTVAVRGPRDPETGIRVYRRSGSNWSQDRDKLISSTTRFSGATVAISGDGNTIATAAWNNTTGNGYLVSYTYAGSWFSTSTFTLPGYGTSIAISSDGKTMAIGGAYDGQPGSTVLWNITFGSISKAATLVANDTIGNALLGTSVALSNDGNVLVTGGPGDNSGIGAAWVSTRSETGWTQTAKLIANDSVGQAAQGTSVSISSDGSIVAVGGAGDNNLLGAVWLYSNVSGSYKQLGYKLRGSGYNTVTRQGASVSIPANGSVVVSGAPEIGSTYIFMPQK